MVKWEDLKLPPINLLNIGKLMDKQYEEDVIFMLYERDEISYDEFVQRLVDLDKSEETWLSMVDIKKPE